jgi:hypothetical protein
LFPRLWQVHRSGRPRTLRLRPLATCTPVGRGFGPSCHCSRVQELSENTKRFGKKNGPRASRANVSGPQRPDFRAGSTDQYGES